jgi:hypothetical protein
MSTPLNSLRLALRSPLLVRRLSTTRTLNSRLRQPGEPTGPNEPARHTSTPPSKSTLKVWPILAILAGGSYLFKLIVDQRKGEYSAADKPVAGHSPSRP